MPGRKRVGAPQQPRTQRWEIYDTKTGEHVTEATFPDKKSASKGLAYIKQDGGRLDLQDIKDDLWIRPVMTLPSGMRSTVSGKPIGTTAIKGKYAHGFRGDKSPTAKKHEGATKGQRRWNDKGSKV